MYIIDRKRDVVGFSRWPWDKLYEPLIGCFHEGRLVGRAVCELGYQPVGLDGPLERWWFRMELQSDVLSLLEQGEPSVVMLRLEDATPILPSRALAYERTRPVRVEEFLSVPPPHNQEPLDGFTTFAKAPLAHQLDILYMDILGRTVDPPARKTFTERLTRGESVLSIRRELFMSDEFMERGVRPATRVGSLATSGFWSLIKDTEPLGNRWRGLPSMGLVEHQDTGTEDFVTKVFETALSRSPEPSTHERLVSLANEHGRPFVLSIILRDAASTGAFFELVD